MNRNVRRTAAAIAALFASAAGTLVATPAAAAPLGTVRLAVTRGTVNATPIFASATTSAPCPASYGRNAQLRVGPPGGPYSNLARPLIAGGYDRQPVTARPNRSFATALGGAPVDGEWWVVVECVSETQGVNPNRFVTAITVSGAQWRVGRPANAAPPTAPDGTVPTRPAPGGSAGPGAAGADHPSGGPSDQSAGASDPGEAASGTPRLAGNYGTGSASLANVWWILALTGVVIVVGVVWLITRRRPSIRPFNPRR